MGFIPQQTQLGILGGGTTLYVRGHHPGEFEILVCGRPPRRHGGWVHLGPLVAGILKDGGSPSHMGLIW